MLCSKFYNMKKGSKHDEASPLCDKIVFSKVGTEFLELLSSPSYSFQNTREYLTINLISLDPLM